MPEKTGLVAFWRDYDRKAVLHTARLADELGYDSIWIPEAWGYEQFQLLTEIALNTTRIRLATGITNVFSRSAALLAMSAATLDEISEGRCILGLGTSGSRVVENLHGVPYVKPLTRLRETVGIVRALWRGERLAPEMSSLFEPGHFRLAMKPPRPNIPIYIASLQDKAVREVGRIGDGWLPTFWPYRHLREGIALIEQGATEAGRELASIEVAPFVPVVPMGDRSAARSLVKPLLAFYIGGMGVYYHALFCRFGFKENADSIRELWYRGQRSEASAAVSDELVDAVAICGPASYCRERLKEWRSQGMGTALLSLPPGPPLELAENLLREMAPGR